jgi:hypothetical protein
VNQHKSFIPQLLRDDARALADHYDIKIPLPNPVRASAATIGAATEAFADAGITLPAGGIELETLDHKMRTTPKPLSFEKRIELKNLAAAAGKLIEPVSAAYECEYVRAALMLVKLGCEPRPIAIKKLDEVLAKADLSTPRKMEIKTALAHAGLIINDRVLPTPKRPDEGVLQRLCARIGLDSPPPRGQLSISAVNKALKEKGFTPSEAIEFKTRLHLAGVLA